MSAITSVTGDSNDASIPPISHSHAVTAGNTRAIAANIATRPAMAVTATSTPVAIFGFSFAKLASDSITGAIDLCILSIIGTNQAPIDAISVFVALDVRALAPVRPSRAFAVSHT